MNPQTATRRGRILIADDEQTFLEAVADYLEDEGYECDCALDGTAAAEKLRENQYDVLISDIRMPGNSELELIERLEDLVRGVPVILVTAHPSVKSATAAVRLPVAAYLLKPLDFDELLTQIRICVKRSRTYRTVCDTRQRLKQCNAELEHVEASLRDPVDKAGEESVNAFVELTLENMAGALSDLGRVANALGEPHGKEERPELIAWTRLDTAHKALREAIDVLETTKRAFKSKQLGKLRHKLQVAVDQLEAGTVWDTDAN